MLESIFQSNLITRIKKIYPDAIVIKNDPTYIQGIPDLIVLIKDKWLALECKRSSNATKRPNQEYYVKKMNNMSFAKFIYPENMEDILDEIQQSF